MATGSGRFSFLSSGWAIIFKYIVSIRVKTLSITDVVVPRRVKRENVSFPVAVRRSKTPLLKLPNDYTSMKLIENIKRVLIVINFIIFVFADCLCETVKR